MLDTNLSTAPLDSAAVSSLSVSVMVIPEKILVRKIRSLNMKHMQNVCTYMCRLLYIHLHVYEVVPNMRLHYIVSNALSYVAT